MNVEQGTVSSAGFYRLPLESASELEYHLLLAHDLELLKSLDYQRPSEQVVEVKRVFASLIHKLRADS